MDVLSKEEIKEYELELLSAFDSFARDNGLRYSLCYGTLLGAVRHGGFIPWDDDIDIMLPYDDYNKLIALAKQVGNLNGFRFTGYEIDGYEFPFTKLVNPTIRVDMAVAKRSLVQYLWIDIFPMDIVPENTKEQKSLARKSNLYRSLIKVGKYKFFSGGKGVLKQLLKMIAMPFVTIFRLDYIALRRIINLRTINADGRLYGGSCLCDICWGPYGEGEIIPSDWMNNYVDVTFESKQFPAIKEWDRYLTQIYGNYMELPPLEKRIAHEMHAYRVKHMEVQ